VSWSTTFTTLANEEVTCSVTAHAQWSATFGRAAIGWHDADPRCEPSALSAQMFYENDAGSRLAPRAQSGIVFGPSSGPYVEVTTQDVYGNMTASASVAYNCLDENGNRSLCGSDRSFTPK
jgi:hypothetical protein